MKASAKEPTDEPAFVSQEVSEARRYYLDLNPRADVSFAAVCGGVERMQPEYFVSRGDFPFYAVELVTEGEGVLTLNDRRFQLGSGVVFAYGPGVAHTIRTNPQKPMRKYYLDITGTEAHGLLAQSGLAHWKALRVAPVHEVVELFEALGREAAHSGEIAQQICAVLARLLLLKIQQRTVASGRSVPVSLATYERIRSHIESHHLRLRTIEDAAEECGVSSMYVARLFRRFGQAGAYQFLLRLKMNHAATLLQDEGLKVTAVAARLGFADAFQFSRAFKRVHGVAPSRLFLDPNPAVNRQ